MSWKVMERRLGRAGGEKQRTARQRQWDARYGEDRWAVGYLIDGAFVTQETALVAVYERSYDEHLDCHPADLAELIAVARILRNPHAEATTGVDLQVPALQRCLDRRGLKLQGRERVDIGSYEGQASHTLSIRLSPLHIACAVEPSMTLEKFWQQRKVLAVWLDEEEDAGKDGY